MVLIFIFGKRVRVLAANSQEAIAGIATYAGEMIQNIKIVQSYTQEENEKRTFGNEADKAFTVATKRVMQRAILLVVVIMPSWLRCLSLLLLKFMESYKELQVLQLV